MKIMVSNKQSVDLYSKKKRWKIALSIIAVVIVIVSMYYTNNLVKRFASQEQRQMSMWAEAVQTHAELMDYTELFFNAVSMQESKRVELLAMAYRSFLAATSDENIGVYLEIIQSNISIPVVITDADNNITLSINLPKKHQNKEIFDAEMQDDFSIYPPIKIDIYGKESSLYYNESLIYTELRNVLDDMFAFFINDVADNAAGVPVIILNQSGNEILSYGNLDSELMKNSDYVQKQIDLRVGSFIQHNLSLSFYRRFGSCQKDFGFRLCFAQKNIRGRRRCVHPAGKSTGRPPHPPLSAAS
jgi:hypothetical protein